jgi:beta-lactamase class A
MQQLKASRHPAGMTWGKFFYFFIYTIGLLLVIIGGALFQNSSSIIPRKPRGLPHRLAAPETEAINGADLWNGDTTLTVPSFDFSPPGTGTPVAKVSPLFEGYYTSHRGILSLGNPLTVAFPIDQGWIQFFELDALLLPEAQQDYPHDREDTLVALMASGVQDPDTGIIRLPLVQALLTVGSQAPVGDDGSPLTYVDLRNAANPALMLPAPAAGSTASPTGSQAIFIKGGTRAGREVGHLVPQSLWSYINRADISPDGWETDFGPPLTEALAFPIAEPGGIHHMLVQVFWRNVVILDQTALDASGQPLISRLNSGMAYLRTLGPPPVAIQAQQNVWARGDTILLNAPGAGQAVAHVGLDFPLTPLGDAAWNTGMLWYHVGWTVPKSTGTAWVEASLVTFASPGQVPGRASFDVLSPTLVAYLASIGGNVDAVVYDVSRQRYYTYNASPQFIAGSSMKVPIMLTFLDMVEREGREPDADEMNLLTTMIENSNNDSASALYYGEIGGAAGVASYLQRIGITGLNPDPDAWGYSLITPLAMVNLLTLLYQGKILTASHRNLAFSLMEQIEYDQQVGVGNTAPGGAVVAMKDGWLPGPDGMWAMNSSGIVTVGNETYIISVYTQEQNSLGDGQAIAEHVCRAVASLLI